MKAIQVEWLSFLSIAWLYWAKRVEPISFDDVPPLGDIALPSAMLPIELKGVAVCSV